MPLESLYFKHNINAGQSPELTKLRMAMGAEGLGIYWCLIEYLNQPEINGKLSFNDLEAWSWQMHFEKPKVDKVIGMCFKQENDYIFSSGVLKRIEEREEKSKSCRKAVNTRWKKPEVTNAPKPDWLGKSNQDLKKRLEEKAKERKKDLEEPKSKMSKEEYKAYLDKVAKGALGE